MVYGGRMDGWMLSQIDNGNPPCNGFSVHSYQQCQFVFSLYLSVGACLGCCTQKAGFSSYCNNGTSLSFLHVMPTVPNFENRKITLPATLEMIKTGTTLQTWHNQSAHCSDAMVCIVSRIGRQVNFVTYFISWYDNKIDIKLGMCSTVLIGARFWSSPLTSSECWGYQWVEHFTSQQIYHRERTLVSTVWSQNFFSTLKFLIWLILVCC